MDKVFIAGSAGTTGLKLKSRLSKRQDIELLECAPELRKDPAEMEKLIYASDYVFLCLPDDAAREAASIAANSGSRIIDASTAHRTNPDWVYGFPELTPDRRQKIFESDRVCSPGCHACGFIALTYPLISAGILDTAQELSFTSITGYSGGGKKMIAQFESSPRSATCESPMVYALGQSHKHLPEIIDQCGLKTPPSFLPIVGDFYAGMLVCVPIHANLFNTRVTTEELKMLLHEHYGHSPMVRVCDESPTTLNGGTLAGLDYMELYVTGSDHCPVLCALYDNLGKGASGAAIQCFNIMSGRPETEGLSL